MASSVWTVSTADLWAVSTSRLLSDSSAAVTSGFSVDMVPSRCCAVLGMVEQRGGGEAREHAAVLLLVSHTEAAPCFLLYLGCKQLGTYLPTSQDWAEGWGVGGRLRGSECRQLWRNPGVVARIDRAQLAVCSDSRDRSAGPVCITDPDAWLDLLGLGGCASGILAMVRSSSSKKPPYQTSMPAELAHGTSSVLLGTLIPNEISGSAKTFPSPHVSNLLAPRIKRGIGDPWAL